MVDFNEMTNAQLLDEGFTNKNGAKYRNVLLKRAGNKSMSEFLGINGSTPDPKTKPVSDNKFERLLNEMEELNWPGHGFQAGLEVIILTLRYCIKYKVKPDSLKEEDHTLIQTAEQYFRAWARAAGHEDNEMLFPRKQGDRDLRDNKKWMMKNENMLLGE